MMLHFIFDSSKNSVGQHCFTKHFAYNIGIGIEFGPVRGIGIGLAKLVLSVSGLLVKLYATKSTLVVS